MSPDPTAASEPSQPAGGDSPPAIRPLDAKVRRRAELLDLGSGSRAGSLVNAMRRFECDGIGIELRDYAVARAQAEGHPVFHGDITELDPADFPSVKYVMIDNVLEHLPDLDAVALVLERSCALASRLVHVRHPSFEDEEYLESLGLKQYWTDWPNAHTAHIRLHEFAEIAASIGVYRYLVLPVLRCEDSTDTDILPIDAPPGQHRIRPKFREVYDEAAHGPKPFVRFDRPVYHAFDVFFVTSPRIPRIVYRHDTETTGYRPHIRWD